MKKEIYIYMSISSISSVCYSSMKFLVFLTSPSALSTWRETPSRGLAGTSWTTCGRYPLAAIEAAAAHPLEDYTICSRSLRVLQFFRTRNQNTPSDDTTRYDTVRWNANTKNQWAHRQFGERSEATEETHESSTKGRRDRKTRIKEKNK